jgi:hypothetical protein
MNALEKIKETGFACFLSDEKRWIIIFTSHYRHISG